MNLVYKQARLQGGSGCHSWPPGNQRNGLDVSAIGATHHQFVVALAQKVVDTFS